MLRYVITLATLLDSKSRIKKHYSQDTVIADLFDEKYTKPLFRAKKTRKKENVKPIPIIPAKGHDILNLKINDS